jgi:hypothetical protein
MTQIEHVAGFKVEHRVMNYSAYDLANTGAALGEELDKREKWNVEVPQKLFTARKKLAIPLLQKGEFQSLVSAHGLEVTPDIVEDAKLFTAARLGKAILSREPEVDTLLARYLPAAPKRPAMVFVADTQIAIQERDLIRQALLDFFNIDEVNEGVWANSELTAVRLATFTMKQSNRVARVLQNTINDRRRRGILPEVTRLSKMQIRNFTTSK